MTLKSNAKVEEKLTLGSKNGMRNLVNFDASNGKSENLQFDVLLLSEVYYVWAKRVHRSHNNEEWCKIWRGTDLYFEKWHEEFCEFWPNSRKTQNLKFSGLILTKVYNVWAKKYRGVMHHYTEDRCKLWWKNDLWFHKWHEEFGEFHRRTQKSKNLHFERLFVQCK